jgi:predicted PurR-regulated permease PerM
MVSQVTQLANDLPRYQSTLRDKIQSLQGVTTGAGLLGRASDVLKDLKKQIERPAGAAPADLSPSDQAQSSRPIPVEVRQPDPGALQVLAALIEPLIHPLTTTGIVVIFVIFILLQQSDLRNRLVRLAGAKDLHRTTAALDDAGQRLSRLFLTQLVLNASFGALDKDAIAGGVRGAQMVQQHRAHGRIARGTTLRRMLMTHDEPSH